MAKRERIILYIGLVITLILVFAGIYTGLLMVKQTTEQILYPVDEANREIRTQIAQLLHPTPTLIPDPVTIVHEIRSLARLETIQYSIEKIITAEIGQGQFAFLFGDRLLFVAHGKVIAGIDMNKITDEDIKLEGTILQVSLPEPEVFIATLDNQQSYIYDRETGLLTHGDVNLETSARKVAEEEILKAALEDGILEQAKQNGESYLSKLLLNLGYKQAIIIYKESTQT